MITLACIPKIPLDRGAGLWRPTVTLARHRPAAEASFPGNPPSLAHANPRCHRSKDVPQALAALPIIIGRGDWKPLPAPESESGKFRKRGRRGRAKAENAPTRFRTEVAVAGGAWTAFRG